MKTLMVNLDRSTNRWDFQKKQAERIGLNVERFSAATPDDFDVDAYQKKTERLAHRPMLPGEFGCFESHRRIWEISVQTNQPIFVLEDDVEIASDIVELVDHIEQNPFANLIMLGDNSKKFLISDYARPLVKHYQARQYYKTIDGTHAYIIYPDAARDLLKTSEEYVIHADLFLRYSTITEFLKKFYFGRELWIIDPLPTDHFNVLGNVTTLGDKDMPRNEFYTMQKNINALTKNESFVRRLRYYRNILWRKIRIKLISLFYRKTAHYCKVRKSHTIERRLKEEYVALPVSNNIAGTISDAMPEAISSAL